MRIALNLLYLIPGVVGGTQTYAQALIQAMARIDSRNEYYLFLNAESDSLALPDTPNMRRVATGVRAINRPARLAWEQAVLPGRLSRLDIDVVHSPGYVCPLFPPCANVVTICDVNFAAMQAEMPWKKRAALAFLVRQSARRADRILTLSEFSRQQIATHVKPDVSNVTVTHLGPRDLSPAHHRVEWAELESRYGIRKPYLIAFSGSSPHKNIGRLVQAFKLISPEVPHALVLLGHPSAEPLAKAELASAGTADRVVATGYVPDAHVLLLLSHADMLVFPSWYEGFGLPVLDAQVLGVPVACSRAASLPEVAGHGAAYFDPYSVQEMATVLRDSLQQPALRASLAERGKLNVARYSWEHTARLTLDVYQAVVSTSRL